MFSQFHKGKITLGASQVGANAGDVRHASCISGSERFPGGGLGNPHSFLQNSMDRGTWWARVHRVTKSWTQLKQLHTHAR